MLKICLAFAIMSFEAPWIREGWRAASEAGRNMAPSDLKSRQSVDCLKLVKLGSASELVVEG